MGEHLLGPRLLHVVGGGLAPALPLTPLQLQGAGDGVEFLELVVACQFVVAQDAGHNEVLGASVEDQLCWLARRRAEVDSPLVNGVVHVLEGHP